MEKQIRNIIKLVREYDNFPAGSSENDLYSDIAIQVSDANCEGRESK